MSWHWWFEVWGWLQDENLWRSVVGLVVATIFAWVLRVGKKLRAIERHLNTSVPGGLTDTNALLKEIRDNNTGQDGKL